MSQLASTRIVPFGKGSRYSATELKVKSLLSAITQPDSLVVFCFCAVGLAVSFIALAAFADFSSSLTEIGNLF